MTGASVAHLEATADKQDEGRGLILSVVGLVATWNAGPELGPRWYPILLVVTALPSAWVGGWIHAAQQPTASRN